MSASRRRFMKTSAFVSAGFMSHVSGFRSIFADAGKPSASLVGERERIVFFGDSITQGGAYVAHLETLMRLKFPKSSIEIHNHGISSETISGTSEPDHDPRRPWAHERFTRDVADWHPTLVFACFGMNDGNYHPFDEARFEKYKAGVLRLIERVKNEAGGARLILCTPPPFDAYQRKNGDPQAVAYGYKYPAVNYDETLHRYSQWLLTLRGKNETVVDLHGPMNRHLARRRKDRVSFTLMPDAVHPDATGHAVMAITIARQIGLDGPRDRLTIDKGFAGASSERGTVAVTEKNSDGMTLKWDIPPSWRFGSGVDADSLLFEEFEKGFNRLFVKADFSQTDQFELKIETSDGKASSVRRVSGGDLSKGLAIGPIESAMSLADTASDTLATAVMKHRQTASGAWRSRAMKLPRDAEERGPQLEELAKEAAAAADLSALANKLIAGPRLKITRVRA